MTEAAAPTGRPRLRWPRLPVWMKAVFGAAAALGVGLGTLGAVTFATYREPSGSMWPTLQAGERFLANRLATDPERGAVVVFRYPEHPDQSFVKRIVGLPGDVVAIENGELVVNGWRVPRCEVGTAAYAESGATDDSGKQEGILYVEYLGAARYLVFESKASPASVGEGQRWTVAPAQYFVLGDNRRNSHDSRMWFGGQGGGVPFGNTRGRLRGHEVPVLPPHVEGAASLTPALAACLAKRPTQTTPPPPQTSSPPALLSRPREDAGAPTGPGPAGAP